MVCGKLKWLVWGHSKQTVSWNFCRQVAHPVNRGSRSVALHCQVLWVTQTLINKIILQKQRKLISNYPESWRTYGNHCWENQITDVFFSLPQFWYILSWVIETKHRRLHLQLQGYQIQIIFLFLGHNIGHLVLWLGTNSCISHFFFFFKE